MKPYTWWLVQSRLSVASVSPAGPHGASGISIMKLCILLALGVATSLLSCFEVGVSSVSLDIDRASTHSTHHSSFPLDPQSDHDHHVHHPHRHHHIHRHHGDHHHRRHRSSSLSPDDVIEHEPALTIGFDSDSDSDSDSSFHSAGFRLSSVSSEAQSLSAVDLSASDEAIQSAFLTDRSFSEVGTFGLVRNLLELQHHVLTIDDSRVLTELHSMEQARESEKLSNIFSSATGAAWDATPLGDRESDAQFVFLLNELKTQENTADNNPIRRTMTTLKREHTANAKTPFRVMIVGAGPAGLLAAITAYRAGASKITLVEKRSKWTRIQVLSGDGLPGIVVNKARDVTGNKPAIPVGLDASKYLLTKNLRVGESKWDDETSSIGEFGESMKFLELFLAAILQRLDQDVIDLYMNSQFIGVCPPWTRVKTHRAIVRKLSARQKALNPLDEMDHEQICGGEIDTVEHTPAGPSWKKDYESDTYGSNFIQEIDMLMAADGTNSFVRTTYIRDYPGGTKLLSQLAQYWPADKFINQAKRTDTFAYEWGVSAFHNIADSDDCHDTQTKGFSLPGLYVSKTTWALVPNWLKTASGDDRYFWNPFRLFTDAPPPALSKLGVLGFASKHSASVCHDVVRLSSTAGPGIWKRLVDGAYPKNPDAAVSHADKAFLLALLAEIVKSIHVAKKDASPRAVIDDREAIRVWSNSVDVAVLSATVMPAVLEEQTEWDAGSKLLISLVGDAEASPYFFLGSGVEGALRRLDHDQLMITSIASAEPTKSMTQLTMHDVTRLAVAKSTAAKLTALNKVCGVLKFQVEVMPGYVKTGIDEFATFNLMDNSCADCKRKIPQALANARQKVKGPPPPPVEGLTDGEKKAMCCRCSETNLEYANFFLSQPKVEE